jgi:hypothetical protein
MKKFSALLSLFVMCFTSQIFANDYKITEKANEYLEKVRLTVEGAEPQEKRFGIDGETMGDSANPIHVIFFSFPGSGCLKTIELFGLPNIEKKYTITDCKDREFTIKADLRKDNITIVSSSGKTYKK